jgi:hypothetical protein
MLPLLYESVCGAESLQDIINVNQIHQVEVYVDGPDGLPLEGASVQIHRVFTVPPFASLVASMITSSQGYAYFDGLWAYGYAIVVEHYGLDLAGTPVMFTVPVWPADQTFTYRIKARPPPHEYEVRINFGFDALANAMGWIADHIPQLTSACIGAGGVYQGYRTEGPYLVVRFDVLTSPAWNLVALAIIGVVALALIAFGLWEVKEIVHEIGPLGVTLIAAGVAAVGIAAAYSYVISRKR